MNLFVILCLAMIYICVNWVRELKKYIFFSRKVLIMSSVVYTWKSYKDVNELIVLYSTVSKYMIKETVIPVWKKAFLNSIQLQSHKLRTQYAYFKKDLISILIECKENERNILQPKPNITQYCKVPFRLEVEVL